MITSTINLTPDDSFLQFTAYNQEAVVVTGAQPVPVTLSWKPFNVSNGTKPHWGPVKADMNAVYGECPSPSVPDMGVMPNWEACQASCQKSASCTAWTFHTTNCTGCTGWINHCCWRTDDQFSPVSQVGVFSQQLIGAGGKNVWVADLSPSALPGLLLQGGMPALHINGHRATLARYPNANPELDIFPKGYISNVKQWLPPVPGPVSNETYTVDLRPLGLADMGRGIYINYTVGIGGNADRYDPPKAFWASRDFGPQRYQPTATMDRWDEMHLRSPSGIDTGDALVNAPYVNVDQMILRTWRQFHWYSWMFGVANSSTTAEGGQQFIFSSGGHQGGEGCDQGAEFFVQGVLEELDAVNEYFYDPVRGKLYFMPNTTDAKPSDGSPNIEEAEVPTLAVLFNLFGSQEFPVTNIAFSGITFTGGRPTFMDPRGQPAGGDWALERLGVLLFEGTEDCTVQNNLFTRIDGNAVFLSGYNRRTTISQNEFSLLGANAIASWGRTNEYDGTGGQQPRHSLIHGNIAHDLGLEQKQSSFYFQAQSCENTLVANIAYNLPRAAVNFEDGFGGANTITSNLLYNTCRESSDHGAFNSWDRMPFVTMVADGKTPSSVPAFNDVHHNMIVANYAADGGCLDNDDGSAWYKIHDNVCLYGGHKSDFDGHSKWSYENLHLYASVYGDRCMLISAQLLPQPGFPDIYANNTCVVVPGAECLDLGQGGSGFPNPGAEFFNRTQWYNNTVYSTEGKNCVAGGGPWKTMADFVSKGYEGPGSPSTFISTLPSADTMVGWIKQKLSQSAVLIKDAVARAF